MHIAANVDKVHAILDGKNIPHEFVLVDDGSTDSSWDEVCKLKSKLVCIKAVRLSRNFGKEAAICAGLDQVTSDACVIMDADLQHPPEMIPEMVRLWREEGYKVVEGVKASRGSESMLSKMSAGMFYYSLRKLSGLNLNGSSDFKLLDRQVVEAWQRMEEKNTFFRGMAAWVGFRRKAIPFEVAERKNGTSKWSVFKLFKLAMNAITSYSSILLQLVTLLGILFLILSIIIGIQTLYMKFRGIAFSGFTTVILLLLLIGSTLMISLGIIGIYISRIFDEVKSRPRYIISESLGFNDHIAPSKPDTFTPGT